MSYINITVERSLQALLEKELISTFFLSHVETSNELHCYHFYLSCDKHEPHFAADIQKADEIFRNYFDSISSNYIISTKIPYKDVKAFYNCEPRCNDAFETIKSFIMQTGRVAFKDYFGRKNNFIFYQFDESFVNKITLINHNLKAVYKTINSHEHYTAYAYNLSYLLHVSLLDLKYYFHSIDSGLPTSGSCIFYLDDTSSFRYDISLLNEPAQLIEELTSILDKEKSENELQLAFAKKSNKLNRLLEHALNLDWRDEKIQKKAVLESLDISEHINHYDAVLDYFQHDYELINKIAHEHLIGVFEKDGDFNLRLDHPLVEIKHSDEALELSEEGELIPVKRVHPVMTIDFSLPSRDKKLALIIKIQKESFYCDGNIIGFELISK